MLTSIEIVPYNNNYKCSFKGLNIYPCATEGSFEASTRAFVHGNNVYNEKIVRRATNIYRKILATLTKLYGNDKVVNVSILVDEDRRKLIGVIQSEIMVKSDYSLTGSFAMRMSLCECLEIRQCLHKEINL